MKANRSAEIGVKKKRWIVCFENTILGMDLSIYEKMVYIVLCSHAKKDGPCFPSANKIAEEASCSRAKVFDALKALEEKGIITRENQIYEGRGQTSNLYEIIDIAPRPGDGRGSEENTPPPSTTRTGPVHEKDAPLEVLEQDSMNKNNSPPAPPTVEEGGAASFDLESGTPETPEVKERRLHQAILDAYNEILPELPGAQKLSKGRASRLRALLKEDPVRRDLEWWRRFFQRVRQYPWPMGHNPSKWFASFDWLLGDEGMLKVIEGTFSMVAAPPPGGGRTTTGAEQQKKHTTGGKVNVRAVLRENQ